LEANECHEKTKMTVLEQGDLPGAVISLDYCKESAQVGQNICHRVPTN